MEQSSVIYFPEAPFRPIKGKSIPRGPYAVLSCHWTKAVFTLKENKWSSVEHYFQAQKFAGTPQEEKIRCCKTNVEAHRLGRSRAMPIRPDWEDVKDKVMKDALYAKFSQNSAAKKLLLSTRDAYLVYRTHNNTYWGEGGLSSPHSPPTSSRGDGPRYENRVGVMLMQLREALREEKDKKDGEEDLSSDAGDGSRPNSKEHEPNKGEKEERSRSASDSGQTKDTKKNTSCSSDNSGASESGADYHQKKKELPAHLESHEAVHTSSRCNTEEYRVVFPSSLFRPTKKGGRTSGPHGLSKKDLMQLWKREQKRNSSFNSTIPMSGRTFSHRRSGSSPFPYSPSSPAASVRVCTYNVHFWKNPIWNTDNMQEVAETLENHVRPDILFIEEGKDYPAFDSRMKKTLGLIHKFSANVGLKMHNSVYSRFPILRKKSIRLVRDPKENQFRVALVAAILLPDGRKLTLVGTHLDVHDETEDTRLKQMQEIVEATRGFGVSRRSSPPFNELLIFLGDFNCLRKSECSEERWNYYASHDARRRVKTQSKAMEYLEREAGFVDCFDHLRIAPPECTTWSGRRVDYVFLGPSFEKCGGRLEGAWVAYSSASDHIPLFVDIVPCSKQDRQNHNEENRSYKHHDGDVAVSETPEHAKQPATTGAAKRRRNRKKRNKRNTRGGARNNRIH